MKTGAALRYQPPRALRETTFAPPGELEVQALWFEQLFQPVLATDDGRKVEIIQPGFWNHTGGPDFSRVAVRFEADKKSDAEIVVGKVEIHLRPGDWNAHGHHTDPAYNETILHVVWDLASAKPFFPATESFRRVPQVELKSQLLAPWEELQPLCASLLQHPLPDAVPGRCSPELAQLPSSTVVEILRAAGLFRLQQKARRWFWRGKIAGPEQAIFLNYVCMVLRLHEGLHALCKLNNNRSTPPATRPCAIATTLKITATRKSGM